MKRRQFIQSVPVAIGGMSVTSYASTPMLSALTSALYDTDRVLVIVQMSGGNDGLNMVFPLDQYDTLLCIINLLIAQIIPAISVDNPWGEI